MSSASPLAPRPVGKPLTSVPLGEEMDSINCVVTPTKPIFCPPLVMTAVGTNLVLFADVSGMLVVVPSSVTST